MEKDNSTQYDHLLCKPDTFDITKKDLQSIINPDNILNFKSYEIIDRLGGLKGLCEKLEVNPSRGLITEDHTDLKQSKTFEARRSFFGQSNQSPPSMKSFLKCLFEFINQKLIIFLLIIATVKMVFNYFYQNGSYFDYLSIYLIVLILSLINAFTNYMCEVLFYKFQKKINQHDVRILRNQTEKIIPKAQIMVGDIVIIASGDITMVDGIVIKTCALSIETINGEFMKFNALNYINNEQFSDFPILLSGTKIIKGYALLLVLNVEESTDGGYRKQRTKRRNDNSDRERDRPKANSNDGMILNTANQDYIKNEGMNSNRNKGRHYTLNESLLYEDFQEVENELQQSSSLSSLTPQNASSSGMKDNSTFINISSPIRQQLKYIYAIMTKFGFISGVVVAIIFTLTHIFAKNHIGNTYISIIIDCLFYVFVILIIAIPSGVELSTSLPLAFSIYKMLEEKTIVKSSSAYEYMAGINYICTDYYGILTKNKMEIDSIFIEETQLQKGNIANIKEMISEEMFSFFCESISVNTIAFTAEKNGDLQCFGDNIECCLIKYLMSLNVNYMETRNYIYRPIIASSPYQSESKLSYTIIKMEDKWDYVRLYVKGTPENILDKVTTYITPGLVLAEFSQVEHSRIKMKSDTMVSTCIFPLIMCYRDIPNMTYQDNENCIDNLIKDLTFIDLIGIKDDLKEDVEQYINDCKLGGINVKLITSQEKKSAKLIAKQCGLIETNDALACGMSDNTIIDFINSDEHHSLVKKPTSGSINYNIPFDTKANDVIDAKEDLRKWVDINFNHNNSSFTFNVTNYAKFSNSIDQGAVIANATAKDKFILVGALLKKGACVAVTGEGLSDSIPMRAAHVGISMGESPNDIAKASSDIILSDNNFKSIVTAVIYGRNIYDCVRKNLQFQISTIISIVIIAIVMASPFYTVTFYHNQLLFINLIIDTLESIALASGKPRKEVLLYKSPENYSLHKRLIPKKLYVQIIIQAMMQLLILFTLLQFGVGIFRIDPLTELDVDARHSTIIFNTIVYMIVFNAIISYNYEDSLIRQLQTMNDHKLFVIIQCLIIVIQFILIEFCGFITKTIKLSLLENLGCLCFAAITLVQIPLFGYLWRSDMLSDGEDDYNPFAGSTVVTCKGGKEKEMMWKEGNNHTAKHINIVINENTPSPTPTNANVNTKKDLEVNKERSRENSNNAIPKLQFNSLLD